MAELQNVLRALWDYLREVLGEKAYARYCDHVRARGGQPMTPREFYLWQQQHKYSRPSRCC
jgi:uncharacterized short protein YbdD (DUF466 family)